VGRTTLSLERRAAPGAGWLPVSIMWIGDAATTQVLLLPGTAGLSFTFPAGEYRLTFTYRRNPGDETRTDPHHRFDRPVEPRDQADTDEVESITWTA
jgi:hypothetical protein